MPENIPPSIMEAMGQQQAMEQQQTVPEEVQQAPQQKDAFTPNLVLNDYTNNIAQQLINKGVEQGKAEGVQQGIQQGKSELTRSIQAAIEANMINEDIKQRLENNTLDMPTAAAALEDERIAPEYKQVISQMLQSRMQQ
jgi:hypothetical protein